MTSRPPLACVVVVALAACSQTTGTHELTVAAASSLREVLPRVAEAFAGTAAGADATFRFSFAGTDTAAAQIRAGAPVDLFAAAAPRYAEELADEGLVEPPRPFATNRLVVIVPASDRTAIRSPRDLSGPVKLVLASASVPIGAYARQALAALERLYGTGYAERVLGNVVSEEDSVESVLAKVRLGEADAGFAYATDAVASDGGVVAIELPPEARTEAVYAAAVVTGASSPRTARSFVRFLVGDTAQALLRRAGFGPPPQP